MGTIEGTILGDLTAKFIEKAKPGRYADGGGLYLLVKPTGGRFWVLRVQVGGKRRDFGLGSVETRALRDRSDIGNDIPLEQRQQTDAGRSARTGCPYAQCRAGRGRSFGGA
ncbi:Arm DNA-binding domain-containing protein [Novosphingobium aquae]|uniref:Arm DNA-binding domain-containing protein n=1 Tax=Novosphingobium aquae TaxID=3133435 RepID=UPI003A933A5B